MQLTVDRKWKRDAYTIGVLSIDGKQFSNTIEDKDRGLSNSMAPSEILKRKVYSQTAIPTGTYTVKFTVSNRFKSSKWAAPYGGRVPEILGVKGFEGIRIHPMNTAADSSGCIGVGKNTAKGMVTSSTAYYLKLIDQYILPAVNKHENITITVK